jgi:hypothetical protein
MTITAAPGTPNRPSALFTSASSPAEELHESALQQQQIMQLRLRKWLAGTEAA